VVFPGYYIYICYETLGNLSVCDSGVVSCCNNVLWILSIVWSRDFAYIILEAGSVFTFSFLLAQQQEPAMLNRLSWMNLALSCLVPELVGRGSLWNIGRHIWTGQYLIFKEDAFLTKPCYFFWIWVHSWTCIFGCFVVHTFKSTLMNRSITLHETVYSATELCLKFSSFYSPKFV